MAAPIEQDLADFRKKWKDELDSQTRICKNVNKNEKEKSGSGDTISYSVSNELEVGEISKSDQIHQHLGECQGISNHNNYNTNSGNTADGNRPNLSGGASISLPRPYEIINRATPENGVQVCTCKVRDEGSFASFRIADDLLRSTASPPNDNSDITQYNTSEGNAGPGTSNSNYTDRLNKHDNRTFVSKSTRDNVGGTGYLYLDLDDGKPKSDHKIRNSIDVSTAHNVNHSTTCQELCDVCRKPKRKLSNLQCEQFEHLKKKRTLKVKSKIDIAEYKLSKRIKINDDAQVSESKSRARKESVLDSFLADLVYNFLCLYDLHVGSII